MGIDLDIDRTEELVDDATSEELVETDTTETELDSAGEGEAEGEDRDEQGRFKKKKTAKDRINELTAKHRQAERERDMEREVNRRLTEQMETTPTQPPPSTFDMPEPKLEDFNYDPVLHAQAHGKWEAMKDMADKEGASQHRNEVATQVRRDSEWAVRKEEFATAQGLSVAEFDAKTTSGSVDITAPMATVIKSAENGAAMAFYLAENPDEAASIAKLPPDLQAYRLGVIESKMEIKPNRPTGLPPIKPAGGGGESPNRNWMTDPEMSTEEWINRRNKQVLEANRPSRR